MNKMGEIVTIGEQGDMSDFFPGIDDVEGLEKAVARFDIGNFRHQPLIDLEIEFLEQYIAWIKEHKEEYGKIKQQYALPEGSLGIPSLGIKGLNEIVAKEMEKRYDFDKGTFDKQDVRLFNGATQAINVAFQAVTEHWKEQDVEALGFFTFPAYPPNKIMNRTNVGLIAAPAFTAEDYVTELEKAFDQGHNIKAILLNVPNNPTRFSLNEEQLRKIDTMAKDHDAIILVDNVYGHFPLDQSWNKYLGILNPERTVYINSLSKENADPSVRLGSTTTKNPWLNELMTRIKSNMDVSMNGEVMLKTELKFAWGYITRAREIAMEEMHARYKVFYNELEKYRSNLEKIGVRISQKDAHDNTMYWEMELEDKFITNTGLDHQQVYQKLGGDHGVFMVPMEKFYTFFEPKRKIDRSYFPTEKIRGSLGSITKEKMPAAAKAFAQAMQQIYQQNFRRA